MKPHPRICKTIKWGGAVATVLLVVVWIGSGWWYVNLIPGAGWSWEINSGGVSAFRSYDGVSSFEPPGLYGGRIRDLDGKPTNRFHWWYNWRPDLGKGYVSVPVWGFVLAVVAATAIAWRLDVLAQHRARTHCPKCNYDRAGIAGDAKCPECGAMPKGAN